MRGPACDPVRDQCLISLSAGKWSESRYTLLEIESGCSAVISGNRNQVMEEANLTAGLHHGVQGKDGLDPVSSSLLDLTLNKTMTVMVVVPGGCCRLKIFEVSTPLDVSVIQGMTRSKLILKL